VKCINCETEWNAKEKIAKSIIKCPFCGENPVEKKPEPKFYENTKEALIAIYKQFGADVLLGKLNAYLPDFAPSVSSNDKGLVYMVYEKGATKVLKENINGSKEDMESAVKVAVRNLTEAYINQDIAEKIVYEFTEALGWKIRKPAAKGSENKARDTDKKSKPQGTEKQTAVQAVNAEDKLEDAKEYYFTGNYDKAVSIFTCLAEQEKNELLITAVNAKARYYLGLCYKYGEGVKEDFSKAFNLHISLDTYIEAFADQGDAEAQFIIGGYYDFGHGIVQRDETKAAEWYNKAAAQGHAEGLFMLGHYYLWGKSMDGAKAFEFYNKAAEKGSVRAYETLGRSWEAGDDYIKAAEWYQKALDRGSVKAKKALAKLKKEGKIS